MTETTKQVIIVAIACLLAWLILVTGCTHSETVRNEEEQATWRAKYEWEAKAKIRPCNNN